MKTTVYAVCAALLASSVAQTAGAQAADNQPFQVLRAGDSELTCDQLGAEFNQLNAEVAAEQAEEQKKAQQARTGRRFGAFGASMLASVAPYGIGRMGAAGVAVAQGANQMANAANAAANAPDEPVIDTTASPREQRLARVERLFTQKGC